MNGKLQLKNANAWGNTVTSNGRDLLEALVTGYVVAVQLGFIWRSLAAARLIWAWAKSSVARQHHSICSSLPGSFVCHSILLLILQSWYRRTRSTIPESQHGRLGRPDIYSEKQSGHFSCCSGCPEHAVIYCCGTAQRCWRINSIAWEKVSSDQAVCLQH